MPVSYQDQFFTVDPGGAPPFGTPLTFQLVTFTDQDDDGLIGTNTGDTFNGTAITNVWVGDRLTIRLPDNSVVTYTGVTFYLASGNPVFTPTDGQVLQNGTFVSSTFVNTSTQTPVGNFGPTCFTPGTMIRAPGGLRAIETLEIGEMVETLDHGAQPIRQILADRFRASGDVAPIRFGTGAIGNTAPLLVSPQHRILVSGWRAELYFGQDEVLVAAKHLVNGDTVRQVQGGMVTYVHLVFDRHEIIFGQGIPSESCLPAHALDAAGTAAQAELLALFPDPHAGSADGGRAVRRVLRRAEAQMLAA